MTKDQFEAFINSFGKEAGEFTKDEIREIGLKHRNELDKSEKSWPNLAYRLGWSGTADSLRHFIRRADEHLHTIPEDDESRHLRELMVEKQKIRDTFYSYKKDIRNEARIEVIREELVNAVRQLPSLPKVNTPKANKAYYREAVVTFADLHLGPDFKNSVNEYSYDIAVKRVNKYVEDVITYCRMMNVKKLHLLNLGDLISGIIHPTIRLEQTLDVTEQIMKAAELLAETLNQLQQAAPILTYRSVVDNHSRSVANKNEHIEKENFNKIVDWFVEERLKDTKIQFMHDNIDDGIGKFELENGKKIMFAHGHEDSTDKCFQNFFGATREFIDYIVLAHYHNSKEKTFNGMKVFVTGSIIGTDSYAYGKRLFSDPEQKLIIFDDNNDVINITINLK